MASQSLFAWENWPIQCNICFPEGCIFLHCVFCNILFLPRIEKKFNILELNLSTQLQSKLATGIQISLYAYNEHVYQFQQCYTIFHDSGNNLPNYCIGSDRVPCTVSDNAVIASWCGRRNGCVLCLYFSLDVILFFFTNVSFVGCVNQQLCFQFDLI